MIDNSRISELIRRLSEDELIDSILAISPDIDYDNLLHQEKVDFLYNYIKNSKDNNVTPIRNPVIDDLMIALFGLDNWFDQNLYTEEQIETNFRGIKDRINQILRPLTYDNESYIRLMRLLNRISPVDVQEDKTFYNYVLKLSNCTMYMFPYFYKKGETYEIFSYLEDLENYKHYYVYDDDYKVFTKSKVRHAWFSDNVNLNYVIEEGQVGSLKPEPFPELLSIIKSKVEFVVKQEYNALLITEYKDGYSFADAQLPRAKWLGTQHITPLISIGASRNLFLEADQNGQQMVIDLENGSLFIMMDDVDKNCIHYLNKETKITDKRYNLTFYNVKEDLISLQPKSIDFYTTEQIDDYFRSFVKSHEDDYIYFQNIRTMDNLYDRIMSQHVPHEPIFNQSIQTFYQPLQRDAFVPNSVEANFQS